MQPVIEANNAGEGRGVCVCVGGDDQNQMWRVESRSSWG